MNAVAHPSLLEDRQWWRSINSFSSLMYSIQTVVVSAANRKHKLKPHSSFKSVSDYLCPLDELTGGGMFSFHLPNIYISLALRNLHFSSTFSLPLQTIFNQSVVIILLQGLLAVNDSTKPKRSLPFKHMNVTENTLSLKHKNSLNGAFLQQKHFHQFSNMSRATEYRPLEQTAWDVVLTVEVLQKQTGTIACHRKHDPSLLLSLFLLEFYEQDVERDNSQRWWL